MDTRIYARIGALVAALGLLACDGTAPVEPTASAQHTKSSGPVLVECPSDSTYTAEGTIDALGGELRLRNHRLALGTLAVLLPTEFDLTEPASQYMELDLRANGAESFGFEKPVEITIDYSRCTRSNIDKGPITVWKIDPATKALLKFMGGVDDKSARTITFTTDSLSAYSIAQ